MPKGCASSALEMMEVNSSSLQTSLQTAAYLEVNNEASRLFETEIYSQNNAQKHRPRLLLGGFPPSLCHLRPSSLNARESTDEGRNMQSQ